MKRILRWSSILILNFVIFFVAAEAISLGIYFSQESAFFYTNQLPTVVVEEKINTGVNNQEAASDNVQQLRHRLNLFWGYTETPGSTHPVYKRLPDLASKGTVANQYGFHSQYNYPFTKNDPNQFIIGVFGGSVSTRLTLQVDKNLAEFLKEDPYFQNKEIVLLSFGNGGYKQPQQLQILSYFLSIGQEFDMVINIDGFNEIALSNINAQRNIDPSMPNAQRIIPLLNLINEEALSFEFLTALAEVERHNQQVLDLQIRKRNATFAFQWAILNSLESRSMQKFQMAQFEFDKLGSLESDQVLVNIQPFQNDQGENELLQKITENWANSSILMLNMLEAQNIPYYHFLQPNQYHATNRVFSEDELEIAINDDSPYKNSIEIGYPYLLEADERLLTANINYYDASALFDSEEKIVYLDSCCHYNQRGNIILARFIAESIIDNGDYRK
ncbi:MAG: hypothetical protein AAF902_26530 [Chloroflexota bacterium]